MEFSVSCNLITMLIVPSLQLSFQPKNELKYRLLPQESCNRTDSLKEELTPTAMQGMVALPKAEKVSLSFASRLLLSRPIKSSISINSSRPINWFW